MRIANYEILNITSSYILITDLGPWDERPTITNSAEEVVDQLKDQLHLYGDKYKRLYYFDSEGDLDELAVADGKFFGFVPGPRPRLEDLA